ncbi:hypothetical protein MMC18_009201 [Xylographa bjoerkii]|nr:hypothetical protein [Xylographa bjoerkii]
MPVNTSMNWRVPEVSPKSADDKNRRISWSSSGGDSSQEPSTSWHSSNGGPLLGPQDSEISLSDCKPGFIFFMKKAETAEEQKRAADNSMLLAQLQHPVLVIGVQGSNIQCHTLTTTSGLTVQEKWPHPNNKRVWYQHVPIVGKPENPDCPCEPLELAGKKLPKASYIKWSRIELIEPEMLTVMRGSKVGDIRLTEDSLERLTALKEGRLDGVRSTCKQNNGTHHQELWTRRCITALNKAVVPPGASKLRVESWRNQSSPQSHSHQDSRQSHIAPSPDHIRKIISATTTPAPIIRTSSKLADQQRSRPSKASSQPSTSSKNNQHHTCGAILIDNDYVSTYPDCIIIIPHPPASYRHNSIIPTQRHHTDTTALNSHASTNFTQQQTSRSQTVWGGKGESRKARK